MMAVESPVKTPVRAPEEEPLRRLSPFVICPSQKERVVKESETFI